MDKKQNSFNNSIHSFDDAKHIQKAGVVLAGKAVERGEEGINTSVVEQNYYQG